MTTAKDPRKWYAAEAAEAHPRLIADLFDSLSPDQRILETGCGSGSTCLVLARHGCYRVTGVDADPEAIALAHRRAQELTVRPMPRFLVARSTRLPFAAGAFEGVIMRHLSTMLATPEDRRAAIDEAYRVLTPTGRLYLAALAETSGDGPGPGGPEGEHLAGELGTFLAHATPADFGPVYAHRFSEQELADLLTAAGFEVRSFHFENFATPAGGAACGMAVVAAKAR
jgi:ubiquinone/menaquinone biosynthesis C-methylase UbiE